MLLGEHAVLAGELALVAALDKRLKVCLTPRADRTLSIESSLGVFSAAFDELEPCKPFQFVIAAVMRFLSQLPSGLDLKIEADFTSDLGLGSSAAVTAATVACLMVYAGLSSPESIQKAQVLDLAVKLIRQVQGRGSGADVAASVYGGVVAYKVDGLVEPLNLAPAIALYYSGSKTPTAEVLAWVAEQFADRQSELTAIYQEIGECAEHGKQALLLDDIERFGQCFNQQQLLMEKLGVNTPRLESLIQKLRQHSGVKGVKISGSGLGDCVIAVAKQEDALPQESDHFIPARITITGLIHEA